MPLVKKPSGWFWGSKGPFATKAKALAVSRAAYASGYKGESATSVMSVDERQGKIVADDSPDKKTKLM
jgi:hypothetical protein